ncbi:hypothetical protein QVD17_10393 [Tagetes erecta]|uniref:Membrane-associated kinase regulator 1 n=1 Tax=Tagetes erecta TaxID=13708 RepID=A0AAD8L2U3_TARER|nr:hypothetical protein QVD17_10393 [Tagetes erecta]
MGKKLKTGRSHTLPSSPTHSSSSSEFEFRVSLSPRKSSVCPADDLFYKGQLLPLHLSPRISMVRTLLLSSSSSSSSSVTTARHSSDSHSSFSTDGCEFDDDLNLNLNQTKFFPLNSISNNTTQSLSKKAEKPNRYFSLSRFSLFRKENKTVSGACQKDNATDGSSVKRMSTTAKEMIRKYLNKAKPLYQKLSSQKPSLKTEGMRKQQQNEEVIISHSFSGNLRYPRSRRSCISSCPSSMRSSPSHSGVLCRNSVLRGNSSSMEELQNAIQGAIAHCKNSMNK